MSAAHSGNYVPVGEMWRAVICPPLTMVEALRAARRLTRHFGAVHFGAPHQLAPARLPTRARRCWASTRADVVLDKGWQRLVHDVSHDVFQHRHPSLKPHHPTHARIEREMVAYVIERGWLGGTLAPKAPRALSLEERRAEKRASVEARLARWQTREKRARTAVRKLRATLKRMARAAATPRPKREPKAPPVQAAPASPASTFPLVIKVAPSALADFAGSEEGAHEDGEQAREYGVSAFEVITRRRTVLEVRDAREASVVFYAVASGTFREHFRRAAERIARTLRPHVSAELRRSYSDGAA